MIDYVFGANILENLTTGMYQDSKVIYREYIQNACDQIDKAVEEGLLKQGQGTIKIWLDSDQRTISIEDNATGIPASLFQRTLGNIADSDKKIGEDKGFRGIGRLCGLAYCRQLIFTSSAKGEDIISVMVCDAKKMRHLLDEHVRGRKYTANNVLQAINSFHQEKTNEVDSHFFRVDLIDINRENTDLLDFQKVKNYLSFVAPVPYQSSFIYRTEVYNHARELGIKIDEYSITLNGEQIFKKYATVLKDRSGSKYDEIFDVYFKDFYVNEELFAWMWVGVSRFQKVIPKINQMRGLRLRKENIQIGGEDALQGLFKQDRGNSYFVGEVFAVHKDLIPNSQRDYFNENPIRVAFERELEKYFYEELHNVYYSGSAINSAYKHIDIYRKREADFKDKESTAAYVNETHREHEYKAVLESRERADEAKKKIEKEKNKATGLMQKVIERIESERQKSDASVRVRPRPSKRDKKLQKSKIPYRVDTTLPQYSRAERKLISKIFGIITMAVDNETAAIILKKIEEGLQ